MRYTVAFVVLLVLCGCGDQVSLDKFSGSPLTTDVVTIQIYEAEKTENRILYLTMFKGGTLDLHIHKTKLADDETRSRSAEYAKAFTELTGVAEHWLRDGHTYLAQSATPAGPLHMVSIDLSQISGVERSIRVPVTKENADKLLTALTERIKPFTK